MIIRTMTGQDIAIELIKQGLVHPSKWARLLQNPMVGYKLRYYKGDLIYGYERISKKNGDVYKSFYGAYITILMVDYYRKAIIYMDTNDKTQVMKMDEFNSTVTVTQNGTTRTLPMYTKCKEMSI